MSLKAVSQETYLKRIVGTFSAGNGCAAFAAESAVIALVPGGSEGFFARQTPRAPRFLALKSPKGSSVLDARVWIRAAAYVPAVGSGAAYRRSDSSRVKRAFHFWFSQRRRHWCMNRRKRAR